MYALKGLALILVLLPLYVHAGAPTGFRDLPWGASVADIKHAFPLADCQRTKPIEEALPYQDAFPYQDWDCLAETTIAEVEVTVDFSFYKVQDKRVNGLRGYLLHFPPEGFEAIKGAFVDRYGPPYMRKGDEWWWIWRKDAFIALKNVGMDGNGWAFVRSATPAIQAEETKRKAAKTKDIGQGL